MTVSPTLEAWRKNNEMVDGTFNMEPRKRLVASLLVMPFVVLLVMPGFTPEPSQANRQHHQLDEFRDCIAVIPWQQAHASADPLAVLHVLPAKDPRPAVSSIRHCHAITLFTDAPPLSSYLVYTQTTSSHL